MAQTETLKTSITLGDDWNKVELDDQATSYYLMAIKDKENEQPTDIPTDKITQVIVDIGIDTGMVDSQSNVLPLTTRRIVLDYDMNKVPAYDNEMNKKTAYMKLEDMPYTFYFKVISINTTEESNIITGNASIILNILGIE